MQRQLDCFVEISFGTLSQLISRIPVLAPGVSLLLGHKEGVPLINVTSLRKIIIKTIDDL